MIFFQPNSILRFHFSFILDEIFQKSLRNTRESEILSYSNRSRISSFLVDTRNSEISHSGVSTFTSSSRSLSPYLYLELKLSILWERDLSLEALSLAYGLIHAMLLTDVRSISYRINFSLTLEAYANQASSHSS